MKKLGWVFGFGILAAGASWADCPNLSGKYVCDGAGQRHDLTVMQEATDGITTYTMNAPGQPEWNVVADGKEHEFAGEGVADGKYVSTCSDAKNMKVDSTGKTTDTDGKPIGDFQFSMSFFREKAEMVVKTIGQVVLPHDTFKVDTVETCSPQK